MDVQVRTVRASGKHQRPPCTEYKRNLEIHPLDRRKVTSLSTALVTYTKTQR